jgi:hypothetical protein
MLVCRKARSTIHIIGNRTKERKVRSRFLIGWNSAWLLAIDDELSLLWEAYAYH